MNDAEARSILSVYRSGESEAQDARFEEALRLTEANPELARWWAEQQQLDRIITSKLETTNVPSDLKARLTSWEQRAVRRSAWSRGTMLLAASIIALAVLFSSWKGPFQPAVSLADYRQEMVSFIKLAPPLELETSQLARVQDWLKNSKAPSGFAVPTRLQDLEPVGCRVLRFRGRDVSLVCFKRGSGKLVHLFVLERAALPRFREAQAPQFSSEGEWTTVSWVEGGHAYLMTAQGDRATLERYLTSA